MIFLVKDVKHEKCVRKTFAKTEDSIEMPNLIQVQKDSYNWFVEEGLGEVLKDISPIIDYTGNLVLEFFDYYMEEKTKYTLDEAKERVNEEIVQGKLKEKEPSEVEQGDEEEGRTPWGDAEDRRNRRGLELLYGYIYIIL